MPQVARFIHISTDEIYGENKVVASVFAAVFNTQIQDESMFFEGRSPYEPTNPFVCWTCR